LSGTLTFSSGLTEQGGVVNHFDLSSNPSGPGNDEIIVTGDLTASGSNSVQVVGGLPNGSTYTLIHYTGNFNGSIANFGLAGVTGVLTNNATAKSIQLLVLATTRGPTNVVWVGNATNSNWDVSTTTNWLNAGVLDYSIPGDYTLFSNLGASNSLINLVGSLAPGSVTINTTSNYIFAGNGEISGIGTLTVSNGLLTVLTTNLYTGATLFDGGELATPIIANSAQPSGIGAASADPGNLIFNGGTLGYFGPGAGTDHGITLTNAGGTFDVSNTTTLTLNGTLTGNGGLTLVDSGTLELTAANAYTGNTTISNGTLNLNNANAAGSGAIVFAGGTLDLTVGSQPTYANNLVVAANSTLLAAGGNNNIVSGSWSGGTNAILNVIIASGGTFSVNGSMTNFLGTVELGNDPAGYFRFNSSGGNTTFGGPNTTFDLGTNDVVMEARDPGTMALGALEGGPYTIVTGPSSAAGILIWQIGTSSNNPSSTFYGTFTQTPNANEVSGITKVGNGTLTLAGQNTYISTTTISSGTLALTNNPFTGGDGSINNSTNITLAAGAFLDVSGRSDDTLTLSSGQLLQGNGTIRGILNSDYGGTICPGGGYYGDLGVLTDTTNIVLGATTWMKLNRASSPDSDRLVAAGLGTISYGGTLVVTNVGAPLHAGDTFTLFSASGFINSPYVLLPNYYTWDTSQLNVNGSIKVTGVLPPPAFSGVDFSQLVNGAITLNATNGAPNGPYTVLSTTNLTLPLSSWTTVNTGNFDGNGNLSDYISADPTLPQEYYIVVGQ